MKLPVADLRCQRAYDLDGDAILEVEDVGGGSAETICADHLDRLGGNELTVATVVLIALLLIAGLLFTLFAMLFDMESNRELR